MRLLKFARPITIVTPRLSAHAAPGEQYRRNCIFPFSCGTIAIVRRSCVSTEFYLYRKPVERLPRPCTTAKLLSATYPSLSFSLFLIHLLTHVCYQISIKIAATALPIFHVEDTRYRPQFRRSRTPLKEREFISIRELRSSRTGYTESLHFSALAFTGPPLSSVNTAGAAADAPLSKATPGKKSTFKLERRGRVERQGWFGRRGDGRQAS